MRLQLGRAVLVAAAIALSAALAAACSDSSPAAHDASVDVRTDLPPVKVDVPRGDRSTLDRLPEAPPAPPHAKCAAPKPLTLGGGKVTVDDDTSLAVNEFGTDITCNDAFLAQNPLAGPQLYYKVKLAAGKTYRLQLIPDVADQALYAFKSGAACTAAAINAACTGHAVDTPDVLAISSKPRVEEFLLEVGATDEDWVVVVDSFSDGQLGPFKLTVEEYVKPSNDRCAKAVELTLSGGKGAVCADTLGATNEFSNLTCGWQPPPTDPKAAYKPLGPQLYYKVKLEAAKSYRLTVEPRFISRFYLFSESTGCSESAIETECKATNLIVLFDKSGELTFTPPATGYYFFAVDSLSARVYGEFCVAVAEVNQVLNTFQAPLTLDIENDSCKDATKSWSCCKDLLATKDWECGQLAFSAGANCKFGSMTFGNPPPQGHSSSGKKQMWGTVLNDCYNPRGNNGSVNDTTTPPTCTAPTDPETASTLKLQVAIPGSWTTAKLSFWSWEDLSAPYDWYEVRVTDGATTTVQQRCLLNPSPYVPPSAWVKKDVDLTAFKGKTVTVGFYFYASTTVNRAGWYVDYISVTGS